MPTVEEAKRAARMRYTQMRNDLEPEERARIDAQVSDRVMALPEWRRAAVVLTYLSFGAEVDTRALIRAAWEAGKEVALPRCVPGTREMRWYRVASFEGLVRSPFGVDEPEPDPATACDPSASRRALALVPGLAFDRRGYRIGYGGGFYDTFLARFCGVSVGLSREAQLVDDLRELGVIDAHDRAVQIVATEARSV